MAHGQGATSNARGGYGAFGRGTRGHGKKPRTVKQQEAREKDPRLRAAFEETDAARDALDALIEEQKTAPALGPTEGAAYALARREAEKRLAEKEARERAEESRLAMEEALREDEEAKRVPTQVGANGKFSRRALPQKGDGNFRFALTTAQIMLKEGYNARYVCEFTGVGWEDLNHLEIDPDGYGIFEVYEPQREEEKCEGLTPSNCGNPSCPAHGEDVPTP